MNILRKSRTAIAAYKENGFYAILSILRKNYGLQIPESAYAKWDSGIKDEIIFWDNYFRTKGLKWAESYRNRFDPNFLLQPRPTALLPSFLKEVHILDVGAGPLTYLGKKANGKKISITAIDPLANEYDKILDKYQIVPLIRTRNIAAENITKEYPSNKFDLVFARNCIDHSYNPEKAIRNMINVVKTGSYVLLEHRQNEAERTNWHGLHQWNFSVSANGDFLIRSKKKEVNITMKYVSISTITCEVINEGKGGEWIVTRILKK